MKVKMSPIYAKTSKSYLIVNFIEGKGFLAITNVTKCLSSVTVEYDYNFPERTFMDNSFEAISKQEFYDAVHKIQKDNGVKFTIKAK